MKDLINILSTKELKESQMILAKSLGFHLVSHDFIAIQPALNKENKDEIITLFDRPITALFTSSNAVEMVFTLYKPQKKQVLNWQLYCINGATQKSLEQFFPKEKFIASAKNAAGLAIRINENPPESIVFFSGNIRSSLLPDLCHQLNIPNREVVVYKTVATPKKIVGDWDALFFYSPSGVQSFFSVNTVSEQTVLVAIGTSTGSALEALCNNKILIADFPSPEKMLEMTKQYFGKSENLKK